MNPILRNILAVIAGIFGAMLLNGFLIQVGGKVIPPPPGAILTTTEGLKESMHLMEPKHFLFPFLAHALGSLIGAFLAGSFAANRHLQLCMTIAGVHMLGGIMMVMMVPSPLWFTLTDLGLAYLPMGFLGWKLSGSK
jgi:hypothetical protein